MQPGNKENIKLNWISCKIYSNNLCFIHNFNKISSYEPTLLASIESTKGPSNDDKVCTSPTCTIWNYLQGAVIYSYVFLP